MNLRDLIISAVGGTDKNVGKRVTPIVPSGAPYDNHPDHNGLGLRAHEGRPAKGFSSLSHALYRHCDQSLEFLQSRFKKFIPDPSNSGASVKNKNYIHTNHATTFRSREEAEYWVPSPLCVKQPRYSF